MGSENTVSITLPDVQPLEQVGDPEIAAAISGLADGSISVRAQSEYALLQAGARAEEAIIAAMASSDAEVRMRARRIFSGILQKEVDEAELADYRAVFRDDLGSDEQAEVTELFDRIARDARQALSVQCALNNSHLAEFIDQTQKISKISLRDNRQASAELLAQAAVGHQRQQLLEAAAAAPPHTEYARMSRAFAQACGRNFSDPRLSPLERGVLSLYSLVRVYPAMLSLELAVGWQQTQTPSGEKAAANLLTFALQRFDENLADDLHGVHGSLAKFLNIAVSSEAAERADFLLLYRARRAVLLRSPANRSLAHCLNDSKLIANYRKLRLP